MSFFGNMLSSVTKTALTPLAVTKDAFEVLTGGDCENTKSLIESAIDDFEEGLDDLT